MYVHRYQLEQAAQAQMAVQLKKLQIIEEKLVQLQSINDEVFGELLALISEEGNHCDRFLLLALLTYVSVRRELRVEQMFDAIKGFEAGICCSSGSH